MSARLMPRTGTYRMADTLPTTAADSAYVSHYRYLIDKNPSWALGLRDEQGRAYYVPEMSSQGRHQEAA